MSDAVKPIVTTVAFTSVDRAAFDAFWHDIRTRYKFCEDKAGVPTRAFAVSMSDMFAEQEAVDCILEAELDRDDQADAIGRVMNCSDLTALLAEYGIQGRTA